MHPLWAGRSCVSRSHSSPSAVQARSVVSVTWCDPLGAVRASSQCECGCSLELVPSDTLARHSQKSRVRPSTPVHFAADSSVTLVEGACSSTLCALGYTSLPHGGRGMRSRFLSTFTCLLCVKVTPIWLMSRDLSRQGKIEMNCARCVPTHERVSRAPTKERPQILDDADARSTWRMDEISHFRLRRRRSQS